MEETIQSMELAQNYKTVKENVTKACEQAGRSEQEVTLLAVSKTKPVDMLMDVYRAGARDFGENKVQELVDKIPQMPSDVRWHMIGHLQRNKVKYIVKGLPDPQRGQPPAGGRDQQRSREEAGGSQYPDRGKCGTGGKQVRNYGRRNCNTDP